MAGIPIPGISSLGLGLDLSKQMSSGSNGNGFESAFNIPFSFDNSGWNVMLHSAGSPSAQGSTGQGSGTGTAPSGGALGGGLLAGINPQWLLVAAIAYVILRRSS